MEILIFLVGSTLLVVIIRLVIKQSRQSQPGKDWLTTQGVVYVTSWDTQTDTNNVQHAQPEFRCLYQVNQKPYILTLNPSGTRHFTQREWENIARYYPSGYNTLVHYDPKHPKRTIVDLITPVKPEYI